MKDAEREVPDAHFTVDKQNISLWPREPPPKPAPSLVPRKPLTIRVALVCLSLVLVTLIVLQAIFYAWLMGTISDVNTNAQLLQGHMENVSSLDSEVKGNSVGMKAVSVQIRVLNSSLNRVRSQIQTLKTSMERANTQIRGLTMSWEQIVDLNAQIPELKQNLDKVSAFNAKVQGLQSSLENIHKTLRQQNDILQMVSEGWKYFQGNFYYFSHISKTWYSAQQFCMSRDSSLTSVTSEAEQVFLYKTAGGQVYWIGLTKTGSGRSWSWVDDVPFNKDQSKRFWIPGEPNNSGNNEHCVNIRVSELQSWNDASCDNKLLFICKRPYIQSEL